MNTTIPETVGLSSSRLGRIDAAMQRYVNNGQLAGAITLLARRGQVAHCGVYGQMDIAAGKQMREDAIFRVFSMTKPVTSLAVLMLYEEGAFHLQYPVSMFIPAFKDLQVLVGQGDNGQKLVPLERPVTIFDLLTHTSGLGYGLDCSTPVDALYQRASLMRADESMSEKIDRIVQIPLHHQPGKRYTYSMGTDVLGYLIEAISGQPLDVFFKERIFEPLGMVDTGFYVPEEKLDRLAALYTPVPGIGLVDAASVPGDPTQFPFGLWTDKSSKPAFLSGGGGLVSTAADFLRFAMMMRNKGELDGARLVSRKTIELMTAPHLTPDQFFINGASCGLGVLVLTDPAKAQMLGSPGAYEAGGAALTEFWVDPQEELVGVLMTQYIHTTPLLVGMDFKVLAAQAIAD
ncbi:MAG: class A beta-lactamase-related serine hydrolase [Chloroflexi bacterium]|nr:MAG: class A beta-lactamase-related serine hydrolase [Chloroflexota bacterium]